MTLAHRVAGLLVAGTLLLGPAAPGILAAQDLRDTVRLADVVAEARTASPLLRAARLRADAAVARVPQAGALPDPTLTLGLRNRPLDGFGTDEPMTMNMIGLAQTFPWPGRLGFAREGQEHLAEAASFAASEAEAMLVARVKSAYYEIAFLDRRLSIMRGTRDLLRQFLDVSNARYAVGQGLQADVLQAQVAVASLTEDITVVEQSRIATGARLNALLGRPPETPLPALELAEPGPELPIVDELMALADERRPALRAADRRIQAAEASYRAARRALYPSFMVGVEYGQRPQFGDMMSLMVGVSIPVWAGSRQLPMRREAAARQAAEEADRLDLRNETWARIAESRAASERARRLHDLYSTSILPQARAAVESSLSAYRVGQADFMTLVQNELTVNRYAIERVRLAAAYHTAIAEIDALTGRTPEEPR